VHDPYNPWNVPNAPYTPTPGTYEPVTQTTDPSAPIKNLSPNPPVATGLTETATSTTTNTGSGASSPGAPSVPAGQANTGALMLNYEQQLAALGYDPSETKAALAEYRSKLNQYEQQYKTWSQQTQQTPEQYMAASQATAKGQAAEQAQQQSAQAARNAASVARSMGLSPAQAALMGSQQMGNLYGNAYQSALDKGLSQYQQGTANRMQGQQQAMQALGQAQSGAQAGAGLAQAQGQQSLAGQQFDLQKILGGAGLQQFGQTLGLQQQAIDQQADGQESQGWLGGIGGILSAIPGLVAILMSDERQKIVVDGKDPYKAIDAIVKHVNPKEYKYKPESGEDADVMHFGPMAQELEQTPLRDSVVDTPRGKMVDPMRLTMGNTGLIAELGKKVEELTRYVRGGK